MHVDSHTGTASLSSAVWPRRPDKLQMARGCQQMMCSRNPTKSQDSQDPGFSRTSTPVSSAYTTRHVRQSQRAEHAPVHAQHEHGIVSGGPAAGFAPFGQGRSCRVHPKLLGRIPHCRHLSPHPASGADESCAGAVCDMLAHLERVHMLFDASVSTREVLGSISHSLRGCVTLCSPETAWQCCPLLPAIMTCSVWSRVPHWCLGWHTMQNVSCCVSSSRADVLRPSAKLLAQE